MSHTISPVSGDEVSPSSHNAEVAEARIDRESFDIDNRSPPHSQEKSAKTRARLLLANSLLQLPIWGRC